MAVVSPSLEVLDNFHSADTELPTVETSCGFVYDQEFNYICHSALEKQLEAHWTPRMDAEIPLLPCVVHVLVSLKLQGGAGSRTPCLSTSTTTSPLVSHDTLLHIGFSKPKFEHDAPTTKNLTQCHTHSILDCFDFNMISDMWTNVKKSTRIGDRRQVSSRPPRSKWAGPHFLIFHESFANWLRTALVSCLTEAYPSWRFRPRVPHQTGSEHYFSRTESNVEAFKCDPASGTFTAAVSHDTTSCGGPFAASVSHDTTCENVSHRGFSEEFARFIFCGTLAHVYDFPIKFPYLVLTNSIYSTQFHDRHSCCVTLQTHIHKL